MVGDADGVKRTARNGDGRDDVHRVVPDHVSAAVRAVTELLDFIDRAQHGVEVIEEEGASRGFGRRTGFGAVYLGRHRNPRIEEVAEKGVIVPPLPSFDVYGMFHKVWR